MSEIHLPFHWKKVHLGELCEVVRGASPRPKDDPRYYGGTIPRLMIADVTRDGMYVTPRIDFLTEEGANLSRPMKKGDLVLSISGTVGLPCFLAVDACIHDGFIGLKNLKFSLDKYYLYFQLLFWRDRLNIIAPMGSIFKNLTTDIVKSFPIFIPLLPEQRAIAHTLRTIQKAKEARQRELELERERKAALMQHLFTRGTHNEPTKQTEIGEIPESWEIVKLGNISSNIRSGITPRGGAEVYLKSGIPLIRSQNVLMNKLSLENVAFISQEIHNSMIGSSLQPGDVLMNITGASIGRVAYVPDYLKPANVNQHVCRIRLKEEIAPSFVSYYLSTPKGQSQVMGSQYGTTRQGLNYGNVRALKIPLPNLLEQCKISEAFERCDRKITALEKEISTLDELFRAMLSELMTGRLSTQPLIEKEN